jgi:hypothetical protein
MADLALAEIVAASRCCRRFPAAPIWAVLACVRNVLDHQISLTIPASIERGGTLVLPSAPLAALAAENPAAADISIESEAVAALVCSGRWRYTVPVVPPSNMPDQLSLATADLATADIGSAELSRTDALALFGAGFAAANDERIYLCGLFIAGGRQGGRDRRDDD